MKYKLLADSGANLTTFPGIDFTNIPLSIMADKEYFDDQELDVEEMTNTLKTLNEKTSTACPNIGQWLNAFEGGDIIVAITVTGELSGSYSSAIRAKEQYLEDHPEAKILVIDSRSAGPRMELLAYKAAELFEKQASFEEITTKLLEYRQKTGLLFSLKSLTNLVNNGRVSKTAAKISGILNLRIIGTDTDGKLAPLIKARGQSKTLKAILKEMEKQDFNGKEVCIAHCFDQVGAEALQEMILAKYPTCQITITKTRGICSYYAEVGGLMVGFEKK